MEFANQVGSEIRSKYEAYRSFKLPFEGNMFLNMAFYYGFQWTLYNIASGELSEISNAAGTIRITSNQIQPRIRNLHAKMTKNRPIEEVLPTGYTTKSLSAAKVTKQLLRFYREIHNEEELDSETINWTLCAGDCFRKVGFDPDAGERKVYDDAEKFQDLYKDAGPEMQMQQQQQQQMQQPMQQQPDQMRQPGQQPGQMQQMQQMQQQVQQQQMQQQQLQQQPMEDFGFQATENGEVEYYVGEVFDEIATPFEMYAPEYATSMLDTRELMQVKILPLQDVKDKWGSKAKNLSPSTNMYMGNQFHQRMMGMANPEVGNSTAISRALAHNKHDLCFVFERWQKPSKAWPRGRVTIVGGDDFQVLFDKPNPYYDAFKEVQALKKFEGIPYVMFTGIWAPGRFWNISPIEPMRPLQAEYNKTISDMVQNRATIGRNKILAPKTANLDAQEIANIHGQFLEYSGIREPTILPAVPLPMQVERETERNRQDMDTVSGSHEVSRAEVPSGVKSGIAINYLLEQDDTTIAPVIRTYERGKRHMALMKISIAKYFYTEDRILQSTGLDDEIAITAFSGADLSLNIRIVPGSALPQSRAALQATYLDLFERGAILDDQGMPDPKRLFDLLANTMPVEAMAEEEQLDLARARRENIILSRGQEILPQHYEDHRVHMKEHNKFRKTEEFYKLDDVIRAKFDEHVKIHFIYFAPPVPLASAGNVIPITDGMTKGKGLKDTRRTASFMGSGKGGSLNDPPSNRGG